MTQCILSRIVRLLSAIVFAVACPALVDAQTMKLSCPHFLQDVHQSVDCLEALFSEQPVHATVSSIPPPNGLPIGIVFERVISDVGSSGGKSVFDVRAAAVRSTNASWFATTGVGWIPALPYMIDTSGGEACHRLGPLCTRQVLSVDLFVTHRHLETIPFYGIGITSPDAMFRYAQDDTYGGVVARMPFLNWLRVDGQFELRKVSLRSDDALLGGPSAEQTSPELILQPTFLHSSIAMVTEAIHVVERPSIPSSAAVTAGPLMKPRTVFRFQNTAGYHWFSDRDSGSYSFRRAIFSGAESIELGSVLERFVPPGSSRLVRLLCDGNKRTDTCEFGTVTIHPLVQLSQVSSGATVPFYLQPTLGGADIESRVTLRGYDDYRFRDANAALLQIEVGRPVFDPLGLFAFYDVGTVAPTASTVWSSTMKHDVGAGLTVRLQRRVVAEAYVAAGPNGRRFGYNFEKLF